MSAHEVRELADDGRRHVAAGLRLIGHAEAGELPPGLDLVDALASHLVAIGTILGDIDRSAS